jgi:hypothetical protein
VTKEDEKKDGESGAKEHYHRYSIIAFKTYQKEIFDVHIEIGSSNMINKRSD